jgi:hypothetical protein
LFSHGQPWALASRHHGSGEVASPLVLNIAFKVTTAVKLAKKFSIMRWFKKKSEGGDKGKARTLPPQQYQYLGTPHVSYVATLPAALLERIFTFVCPHTQDETYESCEQSALEDSCMLCGLRDLAHCVQVSKAWRKAATKAL